MTKDVEMKRFLPKRDGKPPEAASVEVKKHRRPRSLHGGWTIFVCFGAVVTATVALPLMWNSSKSTVMDGCVTPECVDEPLRPRLELGNRKRSGDVDSGTFRIMQVADIHLGEAEDTEWGPVQDEKTWKALTALIEYEHPDLLVFSGDQVTANDADANSTSYIQQLGEFLTERYPEIPYAMVFGNHDDMEYQQNGHTHSPRFSRSDILQVDRSFFTSLTSTTPGIFGVSNYILNVHFDEPNGHAKDTDIAMQIYLLDSGGPTIGTKMTQSQVDWLKSSSNSSVPAVAFQHIPTDEFRYDPTTCYGANYDNGMDVIPPENETGIVNVLREMGRVAFLAVGHNHGNDYCCPAHNKQENKDRITDPQLHLCFGRHSGYGGYRRWERGARVFSLKIQRDGAKGISLGWESWVRLESGRRIHRVPSNVTGSDEGDDKGKA